MAGRIRCMLVACLVALAARAVAAQPPALALRWEVTGITARAGGDDVDTHARFTLTNRGATALPPGWTLWFTAVGTTVTADASFPVRRVTGTLFAQDSPSTLPPLAPGESVSFSVDHPDEVLIAEKGPAGPYLTLAHDPGRGIAIGDYTRVGPRRATPGTPPELFEYPEDIFRANQAWQVAGDAALPPVLPAPKHWQAGTGPAVPARLAPPRIGPGLPAEAALATTLASSRQGGLPFSLRIARVPGEASPEAYQLSISRHGVRLAGASAAGVAHGLHTLAQLLDGARRGGGRLPPLEITDAPRYAHRGLMIDIARNFRRPDELERMIDVMASFKLNRLHLHLSDDEGWRIAIPALPELTAVGARRGHVAGQRDRLPPAVGSGPDVDDPHGSGFLAGSEYIALLRHAADRHIEVIPEIDLPGHARAAIRAMEARHAAHPEEDGRYRLIDPTDDSRYVSAQGYSDNILDPTLPSSLRFVEVVVDELVRLHREAGVPLRQFHLGADEVPRHAWARLPERAQVWNGFFDRVLAMLADRGIAASGWEELGMVAGNPRLAVNTRYADHGLTLQVWDHYSGASALQGRFANAGYHVVLSPDEFLYFGMRAAPDPADHGYDWAQDPPLARTFLYDPDVPTAGEPAFEPGASARIDGIEAAVWSEWVRGPDSLDQVVMPRLLAVAERAWSPRPAWAGGGAAEQRSMLEQADWARFIRQVGLQALPYIDRLHPRLHYRLPMPGAITHDGVVEANYAWPGVTLHYTRDGSAPDAASPLLEGAVPAGKRLRIVPVTTSGRVGRETWVDADTRQAAQAR